MTNWENELHQAKVSAAEDAAIALVSEASATTQEARVDESRMMPDITEQLLDVYNVLTPGAIENADLDGMAFTVRDAASIIATLRDELAKRDALIANAREALAAYMERYDAGGPTGTAFVTTRIPKALTSIDRTLGGQHEG